MALLSPALALLDASSALFSPARALRNDAFVPASTAFALRLLCLALAAEASAEWTEALAAIAVGTSWGEYTIQYFALEYLFQVERKRIAKTCRILTDMTVAIEVTVAYTVFFLNHSFSSLCPSIHARPDDRRSRLRSSCELDLDTRRNFSLLDFVDLEQELQDWVWEWRELLHEEEFAPFKQIITSPPPIPCKNTTDRMAQSPSPLLRIAVYISAHGYGHLARTQNFLALVSRTGKYHFHIRTSSTLHTSNLDYLLHPTVRQTNAYQLDVKNSLYALDTFDSSIPQAKELDFLRRHKIQAIISDTPSLPCLFAHSLGIPAILITNITFDSIFQALLDSVPDASNKARLQQKVNEMSAQYALAHTIIRLPGHIPFPFEGPQIVDAPMHSRKAERSRTETFASLGLQYLKDTKVLLHCFGGHALDAPGEIPQLPEGWACISQTIDLPPLFYKISHDVDMPDLIGACDAVLGKLGWGTCSEVIGNGYKPFINVPRSAFIEEVGLLSWMQTAHRRIVRLDVKDYENSAIEEAQKMALKGPELEEDWAGNEDCLVQTLEDTLQIALK
ncbi:hypothetical protein DL98DRAFT_583958 [Cadophora sp. DSE1049]|nr:hypothetical protein DL98DRAFT_583958 [Cadophora sp. DSE1049]